MFFLGKLHFEYIYYERKPCFINNMLQSDNSVVKCIVFLFCQTNEFHDLCDKFEVEPPISICRIKRRVYDKFASTVNL